MRNIVLPYRIRFCLILFFMAGTQNVSAQRALTDIPKPDPESEQAGMTISDGAAVNLFAADPAISKPIQINFDCTGGLWVASSETYPQIKPGEVANDKIIILRDTDGDGIHDQRTVFAEGLLIPTGVVPDGPHAAYVADSTELVYLRDTDGDGKSDVRSVVFSGFGTEDTHHLLHTLRWGPDGCLYFNQSIYIHTHLDTAYGTRHLDGGGIWRYRPSTGRLEVFCKGFVNPWGHVFDQYGESFVTDGAYFEGINYVFPDSVFVTSPGAERWLKGLNPGSPKHCGLEILSGTHIPESWNGDLVTNDFRSHRVCRFSLRPDGSGYQSRQQPEIITTSHVAFRPIDVRMGPDGALYVADWYNPIIQHGEVDFRDERRDRESGRIWRVSFPGRELDPWPDFINASIKDLISYLEDPSLAVRQFARQQLWLLASEDAESVRTKLRVWVGDADSASRVLELFWMDEVTQLAEPDHIALMTPAIDSPMIRTQIRSVWRNRENLSRDDAKSAETVSRLRRLTNHPDPKVRLETVVMNGQTKTVEAAKNIINAIETERDANLDFAIWQSIRELKDIWIPASQSGEIDWRGRETALAYAVSAVGTPDAAEVATQLVNQSKTNLGAQMELLTAIANAGNASQLGRLLQVVLTQPRDETFANKIDPLIARTQRDKIIPENAGSHLLAVISSGAVIADGVTFFSNPAWAAAIVKASQVWKTSELDRFYTDVLNDAPTRLRPNLIAAIGSFDSPLAKKMIADLSAADDPATRVAATAAMLATRPFEASKKAVELLSSEETSEAGIEMIVRSIGNQGIATQITNVISATKIPPDAARLLLRRIRTTGGNADLENAVRNSAELDEFAWTLTPALSQRILDRSKTEGSAKRGESIYRRAELQCINCHAIGTAGGIVGPNLISLGGSSQPDYILESLLDPNAKLKEGYSTVSVLTDDGELINGIAIGKSEEFIGLRLADGKERKIAVDTIEQERAGKSLMPAGMLDQLTEEELVDLVAFLSELGRTPAYTVSTAPIVRSLQSLVFSPEANQKLNRTSTDTVAGNDPDMKWRLLTSRVDGTITIEELDVFQQHATTPPTSFVRFQVTLSRDSQSGIELPTEGIECWVDGKPTPIWDLKTKQLSAGNHTIVLAIDRSTRKDPFAIMLGESLTAIALP